MDRSAPDFTRATRRGGTSLNKLLFTLVILAVAAALYMFVPPFYENWKLGNMFRSIAIKSSAMENVEQVKLYALEELRKQNFHFKPDQLTATKEGRHVRFQVSYPVAIELPLAGPLFVLRFTQDGGNE